MDLFVMHFEVTCVLPMPSEGGWLLDDLGVV